MAAQALSAGASAAFVDACALAAVDAAAARHRGLEVNVEGVSLSFYRARDGTLTCIETACPHAGHRLCDGYAADPGDIEDLLPGTGVLDCGGSSTRTSRTTQRPAPAPNDARHAPVFVS